MEKLTYEQVLGAIVVIVVLIGVYNTVMAAVKSHREEVKLKNAPIDTINGRLDSHDKWLASDKARIEALEENQAEFRRYNKQQDNCMNVLVRSQLAMLRHMQHGNNVDGMRQSETEITDLLTHRMDSK